MMPNLLVLEFFCTPKAPTQSQQQRGAGRLQRDASKRTDMIYCRSDTPLLRSRYSLAVSNSPIRDAQHAARVV